MAHLIRDSSRQPLEALVIVDYKGRIVEFNKAAQELSGYSREELRRMPVYAFFDKGDYLNYLGDFTRVFIEGAGAEKLVCLLGKGGRRVFARASARLSQFNGKPAITAVLKEEPHMESQYAIPSSRVPWRGKNVVSV